METRDGRCLISGCVDFCLQPPRLDDVLTFTFDLAYRRRAIRFWSVFVVLVVSVPRHRDWGMIVRPLVVTRGQGRKQREVSQAVNIHLQPALWDSVFFFPSFGKSLNGHPSWKPGKIKALIRMSTSRLAYSYSLCFSNAYSRGTNSPVFDWTPAASCWSLIRWTLMIQGRILSNCSSEWQVGGCKEKVLNYYKANSFLCWVGDEIKLLITFQK